MENILLPSKMTFTDGEKAHESILTIEPLHHGYGTTLGNALRRVLLSSLEGSAVESIKMKGAQHEFSAVEGVKEDVLEIILNLKKLRLKIHSDEAVTLHLEVSGRDGVLTAADFEKNADVEIVNTDLVIATLTDKKIPVIMDITVGRGRGFVPTEDREKDGNEIGVIAIDSFYSPVTSVGLHVENTRVGEITNYDKLIMNIVTDGTMSAQEAVGEATKIILNHFTWVENQLNNASLTEKLQSASVEALESGDSEDEETSEDVEE